MLVHQASGSDSRCIDGGSYWRRHDLGSVYRGEVIDTAPTPSGMNSDGGSPCYRSLLLPLGSIC